MQHNEHNVTLAVMEKQKRVTKSVDAWMTAEKVIFELGLEKWIEVYQIMMMKKGIPGWGRGGSRGRGISRCTVTKGCGIFGEQ